MLKVRTPPSSEPVTLQEAKDHLRVTFDDDDALIADKAATARELCEEAIARSFLSTAWRLTLDGFPGMARFIDGRLFDVYRRLLERPNGLTTIPIIVPRAPVLSIDAITYLDVNGTRQTFDPSLYAYETGDGTRIYPAFGHTWPSCRVVPGSVQVDFTAGYGASPADVPRKVKNAIKITLGYLYENREGEDAIPRAAVDLLTACDWGYQP